MASTVTAPIVLTLVLDPKSQHFFDTLREEHFPKERSFLKAHLTLFHHLPSHNYDNIRSQIEETATAEAPLPIAVTGVRNLGRGVAFTLESQRLRALHKRLQRQWHPELTPQDQQRLYPHITVQNKVDAAAAAALHRELAAQFQPFEATGTALQLWAYRGGPWEPLHVFPFLKQPASQASSSWTKKGLHNEKRDFRSSPLSTSSVDELLGFIEFLVPCSQRCIIFPFLFLFFSFLLLLFYLFIISTVL